MRSVVDDVIVHRAGRPAERLALAGALSAGGGPDDVIRLDGAPPGALVLEPSPAGAVADARVSGVRVAGHPVAPGRRRLVRPGETAEVLGVALEVPARRAAEGTLALAGALLSDAAAGLRPVAGRHLLEIEGREAGRRIPLGPSQTLGRGREATVRIADARASRLHVRLVVEDGVVRLEDLGSTNGLRVNATPAGRRALTIRAGDEFALGETSFALVEPFEPAAPAPDVHQAAPGRPRDRRALAVAAGLVALCAAALALAAG